MAVSSTDAGTYEAAERFLYPLLGRDIDEALRELGRVSGDLDRAVFLYANGVLQLGRFQPRDAYESFLELLRLDRESPLARTGLVYVLADGVERVRRLEEIAQQWPTLEQPRYYIGLANQRVRRFESATQALERCVEITSEDARAWYSLCIARLGLGDRPGAVAAAESCLALRPTSARLRRYLALGLWAGGVRRRAFAVALETARQDAGLKSLLFPITLPLIGISRRVWVVLLAALSIALIVLQGSAPTWLETTTWAAIALFAAAVFTGEGLKLRLKTKRYRRRQLALRDELSRNGTGVELIDEILTSRPD